MNTKHEYNRRVPQYQHTTHTPNTHNLITSNYTYTNPQHQTIMEHTHNPTHNYITHKHNFTSTRHINTTHQHITCPINNSPYPINTYHTYTISTNIR